MLIKARPRPRSNLCICMVWVVSGGVAVVSVTLLRPPDTWLWPGCCPAPSSSPASFSSPAPALVTATFLLPLATSLLIYLRICAAAHTSSVVGFNNLDVNVYIVFTLFRDIAY